MQTGQLIPTFSLQDIHGHIWQPDIANGKVLVINFWSAECPCSQNTDALLMPYWQVWGQQVIYVAVASNANETNELVQKTAAERQIPLVLLDQQQIVADLLTAQSTPHFFVFNPTGNLGYQGGFDDTNFRQKTATRFYMLEAVNAILAGQEPDVKETLPFGCSIIRFAEKQAYSNP